MRRSRRGKATASISVALLLAVGGVVSQRADATGGNSGGPVTASADSAVPSYSSDSTAATATPDAPNAQGAEPLQLVVEIDGPETRFAQINAQFGTTVVDVLPGLEEVALLELPLGADGFAVARAVRELPGVEFADLNDPVEPPEVSADRIYRWSVAPAEAIGDAYATVAPELASAHAISVGSGVVVAIVDSGIQLVPEPHLLLAANIVDGFDFVDGDTVPDDAADGIDSDANGVADEGVGHGTHVAGIVHQVAPGAAIMPVRVLNSDGVADEWIVAKGALWAADHGADIVNFSLGRSGSATVLMRVVDELRRRGVVTVAAAGNEGIEQRQRPAMARCTIAVVSTDAAGSVSAFSSRGRWVDVGALGEGVVSSVPVSGYASWDGTSMAAPFVSGQAALMLSIDPTLSVGDVIAYVKGTATPYATPTDHAGVGLANVTASLDALVAGTAMPVATLSIDDHCFEVDYDD